MTSLGWRIKPLLNLTVFKLSAASVNKTEVDDSKFYLPQIKSLFTSGFGSESSLKEAYKQHQLCVCVCPAWRTQKSGVSGEAIVTLQGHISSPPFTNECFHSL